jgi:branched-chain amino acid transport system substrate-binding protein
MRVVAAAVFVGSALTAVSFGSTAAVASSAPIQLGMITSLTGPLAAERVSDVAVAKAAIKNANAHGGINGHVVKLTVEDDQSTAAGATLAAKVLVSDGVTGIIGDSAQLEGGAATYLSSKGIPVAGLGDSPSWTTDSNMFGVFGYDGPGIPGTTTFGNFEKSLGIAKVVGISYGTVPSSKLTVDQQLAAASHVGVKTALNDSSIQLGGQNFATTALQIRGIGAEGIYSGMSSGDNQSVATALAQEGIHPKGFVVLAGYEQSTLGAASRPAVQGLYWSLWMQPFNLDTPAATAYRALLARYAPGVFGGFQEGTPYVAATLLLTGLKGDHGSSSPSALSSSIRKLTDFTANGLEAHAVNYSSPKAQNPMGLCDYFVQAQGAKFVSHSTKPTCGTVVPSTANVS